MSSIGARGTARTRRPLIAISVAKRLTTSRALAGVVLAGALAAAAVPAGAAPAAALPSPAGSIGFVDGPGTSAPPATLGSASSMIYSMLPFGRDSQAVGAQVSSVNGPAETLSPAGTRQTGTIGFSPSLEHCLVGGCWLTWSNGYTGDVYDTGSQSITITLPAQANAFYFYAEPDQFMTFTMTATTSSGATSGPISVAGEAGAQYFGFYTTGAAPLKTITVTGSDPDGFAIGEFGISAPYQFILPDNAITSASELNQKHHKPHLAIDIPVPTGTAYYAITSGTVTRTNPKGDCGMGTILQGDDGVQYTYCHGSAWLVPNGARVAAGTELGLTGNTGHSEGPHLHFQIAYPAAGSRTLRCPQNLLFTLYTNAVSGSRTTVPNPQDLSPNALVCVKS
ncbi:MAG: M23 family metallopeptidase [Streptosporangiaceae bacterium]|nr:M23 family metallopeptidase [Streptosporangiaceae bacterium]